MMVSVRDPARMMLTPGAVLYEWIKRQASCCPVVKVRCRVSRDGFDFTIDLMPMLQTNKDAKVHLSLVRPNVPTSRGTPYWTYAGDYAPVGSSSAAAYDSLQGPLDAGRLAGDREVKLEKEWLTWRTRYGLPSYADMKTTPAFWESRGGIHEATVPESLVGQQDFEGETDLRAWCDKYAADPRLLKQFQLCKNLWGWDIEGVKTAIKSAIVSEDQNPSELTVEIVQQPTCVVVIPDNLLSRAINHVSCISACCSVLTLVHRLLSSLHHPDLPLDRDLAKVLKRRRRAIPGCVCRLRFEKLPPLALNLSR